MKTGLNFVFLFLTTSFLCACATTVEIENVQVKEQKKLTSDYKDIPGKSGWTPEGEFSGQTISDVNMLENKSFWAISFTSPSDLEAMAAELAGGGLSYQIAPCDESKSPNDSRYSRGVKTPTVARPSDEKYFIFIPKALRKAMHFQSSVHITAYQKYMKNAIDSDEAKNLCLSVGAIQYYSFKKFSGRLGSLEELGIKLD